MHFWDTDGNRYLDGVSSLWVTVHGHRVPEIDDEALSMWRSFLNAHARVTRAIGRDLGSRSSAAGCRHRHRLHYSTVTCGAAISW